MMVVRFPKITLCLLLLCPTLSGCMISGFGLSGTVTSSNSFSLSDLSGLAVTGYSHQTSVGANVQTDPTIISWCLSETQSVAPANVNSTCVGGQGSVLGWSTTVPTSFNLSSGDGLKKVYLWVADSTGAVKQSVALSYKISLDTTNPAVSLSSPLGGQTYGALAPTITWTASDVNFNYINIDYSADSGTTWNSVASQIPNTGSYTWPGYTGVNSAHTRIRVTATDMAGNLSTSASTSDIIIDTVSPVVSLTTPLAGGFVSGGNNYTVTWSATSVDFGATPISLSYSSNGGTSWTSIVTNIANSGSYTWAVPAATNSTTFQFKILAQDNIGNSTSVTSGGNFTVDSNPPVLSYFSLNGGSGITTSSTVSVAFNATDNLTDITSICLKVASSAPGTPLATDSCWGNLLGYGVTPGPSISTTALYFNIGSSSGVNTVYAWLMDQAGNISKLSPLATGTAGVDNSSVTYAPPSPPLITAVQSSSTDTPSSPLSISDLTVVNGGNTYLKWQVSSSNGLAANPITVYYTNDDANYTLLSSNLLNGINGACTLTGSFTGCSVLAAPAGTYFKFKIKVTDSVNLTTFGPANAMNAGSINFLAGNTDLGVGSSAKSSILQPIGITGAVSILSVLNNGQIFFADTRGLGWVNPVNGNYEILIPQTGVDSGDGGPASSATLNTLSEIFTDSQDNLLLVDVNSSSHLVVRKLNTTSMTINAFLGGGTTTTDTVTNPLNFGLATKPYSFYPLPNGDIWFMSDPTSATTSKIRIYSHSTTQITTLYLSGTGNSWSTTQNNQTCYASGDNKQFFVTTDSVAGTVNNLVWKQYSYGVGGTCYPTGGAGTAYTAYASVNPTTGISFLPAPAQILPPSGRREDTFYYTLAPTGDLYAYYGGNSGLNSIYKYNTSTLGWTLAVGNGSGGTCNDGTLATACSVTATSVAVTPQGQIFYFDYIARAIRTVDGSGLVQTLVGDKLGSADGTTPLLARFGFLTDIKVWSHGTDDFYPVDFGNSKIRHFTTSTNLTTIAGTGTSTATPGTTTAANIQALLTSADANTRHIVVDPTDGDIYFPRYGSAPRPVSKIANATGKWVDVVTGNSLFEYGPGMLGINGTTLMIGTGQYCSSLSGGCDSLIGTVNVSTTAFTDVIHGTFDYLNSGTVSLCADGVALNNCIIGSIYGGSASYQDGRQSAYYDAATSMWLMAEYGFSGRVAEYNGSGAGNFSTLVTLPRTVLTTDFNRNVALTINYVYYCGNNGKLYKYNINSATETNLPLPTAGMSCITGVSDSSVQYSSTRNSLIFIYQENGLTGVAEYLSP